VPHLHWHVIPRWADDSHFPAAIWATPAESFPVAAEPRRQPSHEALRVAIVAALAEEASGT
jgi:diadenosine tetraphosphate (Ap4A) HIT family hydrolase